jgi:3-dehydroquinate synthase
VKYGVIASRPLFDRLTATLPALFARDPDPLTAVVTECCRIKAEVVERDERESGPRRALNFGHTIGHALEAVTKYRRFRHGEAVGYGMLAASELAVTRGVLPEADRQALAAVITKMGPLPPIGDLSAAEILDATTRDKKVIAGRLHFVLPTAIGATTTVTDVTTEELRQAVTSIGARPGPGPQTAA